MKTLSLAQAQEQYPRLKQKPPVRVLDEPSRAAVAPEPGEALVFDPCPGRHEPVKGATNRSYCALQGKLLQAGKRYVGKRLLTSYHSNGALVIARREQS